VCCVDEKIQLDMRIVDFIAVVKQQQLSNENIRTILGELGETLSKNSISNIYTAAGFEVLDSRKKIIEPTAQANYDMTLKEAVQLARALRMKSEKQPRQPKVIEAKAAVVIEAPKAPKTVEFGERIYSNPFPIERAAEAKDFILAALDLTQIEFESIKNLINSKNEFSSNPFESIHEAVKELGGRDRKNKTYYISTEIIDRVAEFAEEKSVKVSQFVEIALLDAMKKYQ